MGYVKPEIPELFFLVDHLQNITGFGEPPAIYVRINLITIPPGLP